MSDPSADQAVKTKHRAMWASGDYPVLASDLIWELGSALVDACGVQQGDRVLDVAAGSGNAAIRAAQAGAEVVASDLTPELFETGRAEAAKQNVELDWQVADAENLPYEDGEFDKVISCVGIMFAPNHEASSAEFVRVCRAGGTLGLLNWTPEGFIGQMLKAIKPYAPPPPPGAQPGPLWGSEDHVRSLFGDKVTDVSANKQTLKVDHYSSGEEFRDYFKRYYGPTIAVYKNVADDAERTAALDEELADLGRRFGADDGTMEWEYLLLTARKV